MDNLKKAGPMDPPETHSLQLLLVDRNKQSRVKEALVNMPAPKADTPVKKLTQYRVISPIRHPSRYSDDQENNSRGNIGNTGLERDISIDVGGDYSDVKNLGNLEQKQVTTKTEYTMKMPMSGRIDEDHDHAY
jgi:hypothetical protein